MIKVKIMEIDIVDSCKTHYRSIQYETEWVTQVVTNPIVTSFRQYSYVQIAFNHGSHE